MKRQVKVLRKKQEKKAICMTQYTKCCRQVELVETNIKKNKKTVAI